MAKPKIKTVSKGETTTSATTNYGIRLLVVVVVLLLTSTFRAKNSSIYHHSKTAVTLVALKYFKRGDQQIVARKQNFYIKKNRSALKLLRNVFENG